MAASAVETSHSHGSAVPQTVPQSTTQPNGVQTEIDAEQEEPNILDQGSSPAQLKPNQPQLKIKGDRQVPNSSETVTEKALLNTIDLAPKIAASSLEHSVPSSLEGDPEHKAVANEVLPEEQATRNKGNHKTDVKSASPAPVQPSLTSEAALERIEGLLRRLCAEHDPEGFFQEKVSTELKGCENYYERIKSPMWFSRIRSKLRSREYRTLHQLQSDVELICCNAITFNLKPSKVYKNAQALSKASKRQFQIERSLLLEAVAVLHPAGPEAAKKDEVEEEKQLKSVVPPKKPAKPSKPPKKPITTATATGTGGSGSHPNLMSSPSSGNLAALAELPHSLPSLGEAEDLLIDVHAIEEHGFSSFSETEDERPGRQVLDRMGAQTIAQPWKRTLYQPSLAGTQAAAATNGQPNAWKARRRCTEWRVRWLELRLRELKYQQARYEQLLDQLKQPSSTAGASSRNQDSSGPMSTQPAIPPVVCMRIGDEPPRKRQRKQRSVVKDLDGNTLLNHPFFAAEAGLHKCKQAVKDAQDADVSDDDVNYPARAYAAAELLERHCLGLRELLCQPESEARPHGKQPVKGGGRGRASGVRSRGTQGKTAARYRRSQEGATSGFLVHGLPSQHLDLGKPVKDILIPKFKEHSAEELSARAELLAHYERRAAKRKALEEAAYKEAHKSGEVQDMEVDAESSSSEDTSDEAFLRTHNIEEERERAKYEGEAKRKKRSNKSKVHSNNSPAEVSPVAVATEVNKQADAGEALANVQLPGIKAHADPVEVVGQPGSPTSEGGSPKNKEGKRGRPPGAFGKGRGRGRGRGRPPNLGRGSGSAANRLSRPPGPGRGHKGQKMTNTAPASNLDPQPAAPAPAPDSSQDNGTPALTPAQPGSDNGQPVNLTPPKTENPAAHPEIPNQNSMEGTEAQPEN